MPAQHHSLVRREGGAAQESRSGSTSAWEWTVAALGALLVFAAIGFMLSEALTEPDTPPIIKVSIETIIQTEYGYIVQFRAYNHGQQTAARLVVDGELKSDTGTVEKAQVTIDYLPSESGRTAALLFTNDPREYTVEIKPRGYDRP